jgi:hypothetical protein
MAGGSGLLGGRAQEIPGQSYIDNYIALPQTPSTIPAVPMARPPIVVLARANAAAQEPATAVQEKPSGITPADPQKQGVAGEAADLLKMATALKAEVDKTTKDTLSVAVVRKADEIEQLAHKVRVGAGKD